LRLHIVVCTVYFYSIICSKFNLLFEILLPTYAIAPSSFFFIVFWLVDLCVPTQFLNLINLVPSNNHSFVILLFIIVFFHLIILKLHITTVFSVYFLLLNYNRLQAFKNVYSFYRSWLPSFLGTINMLCMAGFKL